MITYRASLDVPNETLRAVTGWLRAHRRVHDRRPWQRAATVFVQAVMVLRWFKDDTDIAVLARDAGVSIATGYRYLHEAIDVIAAHAPELSEVLAQGLREGWELVCLDGALVAADRCRAKSESGHDAWYSGKHKQHGGNVQVLCDPSGYPVWASPAEPGSTHDITCARAHALGPLYKAATDGLPTLTDKGYTGAGIGIHVPVKGRNLDPDTSHPQPAHRCPASTGRTRERTAQTNLESTSTCQPRPEQNLRHHRRRPRPTPPPTRGPVRKPHYFPTMPDCIDGLTLHQRSQPPPRRSRGQHSLARQAARSKFCDSIFV